MLLEKRVEMINLTWIGKMRPQVDKEANMISQLPKRMRSRTDPTLEVFNLEQDWVQFIL